MSSETIRVRNGDTFEVSLREPAATGHRWRLGEAPAQVALVDERYVPPRPGSPIGSAGRRIATLRVTDTGHYLLKFELSRPWDAQTADEHLVEVDAV